MKTNVERVVEGYLSGAHAAPSTTFSLRLSEEEHAKLKFLAQKFGVKKTRLARELLSAAMCECEDNIAANTEAEAVVREAFAELRSSSRS